MNVIVAWLIFLAILWAFLIAAWWFQRAYYDKMIRLGVEVVLEAQRVADEYPDTYANYRLRAVKSLDDHAVGALVRLLPPGSKSEHLT